MNHIIDTKFYPGWTRKAITFSIDDGNVPMDRKFIEILRPAGIRGTFNLCSQNLQYLTPEEYREFYKGDEIANHCKHHPYAFADGKEYRISNQIFNEETADPDMVYPMETEHLYKFHASNGWRNITDADGYMKFVEECHTELEEVFGAGSVRSFVWPFDQMPNQAVVDSLAQFPGYYGIRRSGQWGEKDGFPVPACREERLPWHYTATHANLLEVGAKYEENADDGNLKYFCLGVHSIDFERDDKWEDLKTFAARYGNRPKDYYYAPVGEIFDYVDAMKEIVITDEAVVNPTDKELYIRVDGEDVVLKAGETLALV